VSEERFHRESWSAHKLAEFLALISTLDDEQTATARGVDRVAEVFDAEAAALVVGGRTVASVGFGGAAGPAPAELVALTEGEGRTLVLAGLGACHAVSVRLDEVTPTDLVVARAHERFDRDERDLLRGMGRVLALGLRSIRLLDNERRLRSESERQSAERAHLLGALRERQVLVERLSRLQRAIVDGKPLHDVLEAVVEGACELLGDEVAVLRRWRGSGAEIAASIGVEATSLGRDGEAAQPTLTGRAREEDRVVVVDPVSGGDPALVIAEFGIEGVGAGIACPVYERGSIIAGLAVGSRDELREYGPRDQQVLLAFAELASLAFNHALAIAEAMHEAFHDGLTSLPNRTLFADRLEHALTRAGGTGRPVGVLFCDLDGFKTVNDSLGHAAGDELLVEVAARLQRALGPADTVARLGGDEFAVLIDELDEPEVAARAGQRILEALEPPFELGAREIFVSASIGIATGTADAGSMLRNADLAMYRAKSDGKGRYALFEPRLHTAIVERLELEVDLKRAIERGELELVYQPIFSLRSGAIAGLEALVRWHHPTRGLVHPDAFIPLAEESGQIRRLGAWVLREACSQASLWRARYPAMPGLQVGVNISGAQLSEGDLVGEVKAALDAASLEPGALTLELTETVLMHDVDEASSALHELKAVGIELAIDDFGRGYSSLTYLQRFPLDNLKIDRAFITAAGQRENIKLLRAIIDLAEIFDLRPIAEGIEHREELERLLSLGCELGQGHLFSEPLTAKDADALLLRVGLLGSPAPPVGSRADEATESDPHRLAGDPRRGRPSGGS
jgi:diguanylate cyclase (GGDEF)-like protein